MKRKLSYGGGQGILNVGGRRYSDIALRKIMIQAKSSGKDVLEVIQNMNHKNQDRAYELLNFCPTLCSILEAA